MSATACARLEREWADTTDTTWANGQGTRCGGDLLVARDGVPALARGRGAPRRHRPDVHLAGLVRRVRRPRARPGRGGPRARLPDELAIRLDPTDAIGCWIIETVPQDRLVLAAPRHELLAWLLDRHPRPDWPVLTPW